MKRPRKQGKHQCPDFEALEARLLLSAAVYVNADPNDQIGEAKLVKVGKYLTDSIGIPTKSKDPGGEAADVDIFRFTVRLGQRVGFDLDRTKGSKLDSQIRLFDATGAELASNDDGAAPGEKRNTDSYLVYTFTAAGTYYVGVSGHINSAYDPTSGILDVASSTGGYKLTFVNMPIDTNDQIREATTVAVGKSVSSSVAAPGKKDPGSDTADVDMYRFTAAAGQGIGFDIDRTKGSKLDSWIRLFDASGAQLAFNDDAAAPKEKAGTESYLTYTFAAAGTYYIGVSGASNHSYDPIAGTYDIAGSIGGYKLTLTNLALDPNDQISEATTVVVGRSVNSTISPAGTSADPGSHPGDVDMYAFAALAGQAIGFDIDRASGSSLDSWIRLFDAAGTQLAANDDGAAPGETASYESYLEYSFAADGTYYIGVSGWANSAYDPVTGNGDVTGSTGGYKLSLALVSMVEDPNDQIAEATPVVLDTPVDGTISPSGTASDPGTSAGDVDMYSFTVAAGDSVAFDIDLPFGGTLDSWIRIFDVNGNQLASNDDGLAPGEGYSFASYLEYTFTNAGTYYVGVSGYANALYDATSGTADVSGSTGDYTLTLTTVLNNTYDIELVMTGLTVSQEAIFQQAADRWEQMVVGELPDAIYAGVVVDDLRIDADSIPIDGPGGILGWASATDFRANWLPYRGFMQFDTADLAWMEANNMLLGVVMHEMCHVMGFGIIWTNLGLLAGAATPDPRFTGVQATAWYNNIFGVVEPGVPVEATGGPGTALSHWRETVFDYELMTGWANGALPVSRVTVAAMADMGYTVSLGAADPYTKPIMAPVATPPTSPTAPTPLWAVARVPVRTDGAVPGAGEVSTADLAGFASQFVGSTDTNGLAHGTAAALQASQINPDLTGMQPSTRVASSAVGTDLTPPVITVAAEGGPLALDESGIAGVPMAAAISDWGQADSLFELVEPLHLLNPLDLAPLGVEG